MRLHGKTALVTGGAKRIGRAIVLELAHAGANVVVHYRLSAADAERTCARVHALGVGAAAVQGDLGQPADVERIAGEAQAAFGAVDILVNSASVFGRTPIESLFPDEWEQTLSVNLRGPFFLAARLGRRMQERGGGNIVNIADWAGLRPYRDYLPYCVSKAGVVAMTRGLAKALAPAVRVNCVAPGPVLPPEDYSERERQALIAHTPLQRLGSAEAVARLVRFLATEADFCTGAVYLADGGRLNA